MTNLFMFLVFAYIALTVLSFTLEGETGLASTIVTTAIEKPGDEYDEDTPLIVHSTEGFLSSDFINVEDEIICYSGTTATSFTGLTRGCHDSSTNDHAVDTAVYNETTGFINKVVGFNIVQSFADDGFWKGIIKTVIHGPGTLKYMFTKLVLWDYSFLEGNGVYIKYLICYPLSAGFILSLAQLIFRKGG